MPLTRSFNALVQRSVTVDPVFGAALLREEIDTMLTGDVDTGKAILRPSLRSFLETCSNGCKASRSGHRNMRFLSRRFHSAAAEMRSDFEMRSLLRPT
jgi:hypothetical protein